jgi:hypothetical protein
MRLITTSVILTTLALIGVSSAQDTCAIQCKISAPKIPLTCTHNGHWNIFGTSFTAMMSINGSDWVQPSAGYTGLAALDMSFYVNNQPATGLNITLLSNVQNSSIVDNNWLFTLDDYQPLFGGSIDLGYYGCRYDTPKPNITISITSVSQITAGTFGEFTCAPVVVNALDKSNNRDYVATSAPTGSSSGSSSSKGVSLSLGAIIGIAVGLLFLILFGVTCGLAYKVLVVDRRAEKKQAAGAAEKKVAETTPALVVENKTALVEQPADKPVEMEAIHVHVEEAAAESHQPTN